MGPANHVFLQMIFYLVSTYIPVSSCHMVTISHICPALKLLFMGLTLLPSTFFSIGSSIPPSGEHMDNPSGYFTAEDEQLFREKPIC